MILKADPDWWKVLFDDIYLVTDARSVCNDEITRREINVFSRIVPLNPSDRIVDLCGGQGRHAIELCRRGFRDCTVMDYSKTLLKIGLENAKKEEYSIKFVQGDARWTELGTGEYDHVLILGNSLGYISEDKADLLILSEGFRLLKTDGWLLLDITDGEAVRENFKPISWHEIGEDVVVCRQREIDDKAVCSREMVHSKKKGLIRDKTYRIRLYNKDQLEELITRAGFRDIMVHSADRITDCNKEDLGYMNHRLLITGRKK